MNKRLVSSALLLILISGFVLAGISFFTVRVAADVATVIDSDTTWTKANSPYRFGGSILIASGATLTIEPGVTVNLLGFETDYPVGYDLTVEGTLVARGSNSEPIHFSNGSITFEPSSTSWNDQDDSGCIIENALLNGTLFINSASPKIRYNSLVASLNIKGGSPLISDNKIIPPEGHNIYINDGTAAILNNEITCPLRISDGSPVIYNNTITLTNSWFDDTIGITADFPVIANNIINSTTKNAVRINSGTPSLLNNIIQGGNEIGVNLLMSSLAPNNASVSGNIISDCTVAGVEAVGYAYQYEYQAVIERNLFMNNKNGIRVTFDLDAIIRENTITNNYNGLFFVRGSHGQSHLRSTFLNNNIYANSNYDVELQTDPPYEYDVNITHNWWGTTDAQSINLKMFDSEDDPNLGTANFAPYLTEPNPDAPLTTYIPPLIPLSTLIQSPTPTPTPTSTPAPTSTPTLQPTNLPTPSPEPTPQETQTLQFETIIGATITVAVIIVGLSLLFYLIKGK